MNTRMHSSRMRNVHCSGCLAWEVGVSAQGGGCLPRGVSAWGCLPGGVCLWFLPKTGCLPEGNVCLRLGVCLGSVCMRGEGCTSPDLEVDPPRTRGRHHPDITPLWSEFLTHACENITFPQLLLRAVKITISLIQ